MKSALYSNGFINVSIEIDDDDVAFHVMNYLAPEKNNISSNLRWKLQAFIKKNNYEDRQRVVRKFKGEYGESLVEYVIDNKHFFYNKDNATTYFWKDNTTLLLFNDDKKGLFIDTYRAIRQMMISDLLNRGGVVIHSSSVFINQKGYLFVGNKRAGKTSSLFQYLNDSSQEVCYGSNERTILVPDNGKVYMYGWPGTAFVGVGTIESTIGLSSLYDVHKRAGGTAFWLSQHQLTENKYIDELIAMGGDAFDVQEKIWLTSNEIAYLTGKEIVNYGHLDKVIWPNLAVNVLQSIEQVKRSLKDEIISDLDFFNDWLNIRNNGTKNEDALILDMIYDLPQYEITGGRLVTKVDELP